MKHSTEMVREFKGWVAFGIAVVILACVPWGKADAGELSLDLTNYSALANDNGGALGNIEGVKLAYTFGKKEDTTKPYVFGSLDKASITYSIDGFNYKIEGIGGGFKNRLTQNIELFADVGYYFISNDWGNREFGHDQWCGGNEGLCYDFKTRYSARNIHFEGWDVETDNAIGGTVGMNFSYPVTECFTVGASFSYRHLVAEEIIKGRLHRRTPGILRDNPYFYRNTPVNFSGFGIGLRMARQF